MIDLTPLDVRKKAGDFKKTLRGYDPDEVDGFIQLVSERLEELVKENLTLRERTERLQEQVVAHEGRESAVREALVMAQKLREDLTAQVEREVQIAKQGAELEIRGQQNEAKLRLGVLGQALTDLERRRIRFLRNFKTMLQRELEAVEVEESRSPHTEAELDLELGTRGARESFEAPASEGAPAYSLEPPPAGGEAAKPTGPDSGRDEHVGERTDPGEGLWLSPLLREIRGGSE
jgi:cell division initiation protein